GLTKRQRAKRWDWRRTSCPFRRNSSPEREESSDAAANRENPRRRRDRIAGARKGSGGADIPPEVSAGHGQAEALKRLREAKKDLARVKTLLRLQELTAGAKPAKAGKA